MRSFLYILILAVTIAGCEQPTEFERENTSDPAAINFIPNAIESFDLTVNENHIRLEWKPGSEFINGFLLEKTNSAGEFEEVQTFDKNITAYSDESISPFSGQYRIQYLEERDTESNPALTRSYNINPTNFSIVNVQNDGIDLEWNKNTYFETTASIEWKSNSGTYETITTVPTATGEYRFTGFGKEAIGKNIFRFTEYSEIDSSDTLESVEVRLPVWQHLGTIENLSISGYKIKYDGIIYGFTQGFSYKMDLTNFVAEQIEPPPDIGSSYNVENSSVLGNKIVMILPENNYAIYDPITDSWQQYQEPLLDQRTGSSIIKLDENRLLVSGGGRRGANGEILKSALIFDIRDNSWTEIANMNVSRYMHNSVHLENGEVLVAGSITERHIRNTAEIYNIDTNQWQMLDDPPIIPYLITMLENGKILVVSENESVEFNPLSNTWENRKKFEFNDRILRSRTDPILVSLPGGNALLIGMIRERTSSTGEGIHSQIYLHEKEAWVRTGNLHYATGNGAYVIELNDGDLILFHRRTWMGNNIEFLKYSNFR
jgi:hypothetical protein